MYIGSMHGPKPRPLAERFWPKVDQRSGDECWPWLGSLGTKGYGQILAEGLPRRLLYAHRVAYTLAVGPIPDGIDVLHSCDNPPCCRPDHLFLGTQGDNNRDRHAKGRDGEQATGEAAHNAKVSDAVVAEIRERYAAGGVTQADLAAEFGIKQPQVSRIVRRASRM